MNEVPTADLRSIWGPRIAKARKERGLTQVQVAVDTGRDPQTISRIERGDGMLLDTYLAVAGHLGLDLIGETS